MKSKKKTLMLLVCAVLLVVGSVMGTMAYLTSTTGPVTNTFTVGDVAITLDEAKVNEYGDAVADADRVTVNEYKLIPGHEYTKDPTIHVTEGSETSYVFAEVSNGLAAIEADTTIEKQMGANGWIKLDGNVYYYNKTVDAREDAVDLLVFSNFTLTDNAEVADYGDAEITIKGYAVQADGFDTAAEAWEAAFAK